MLNKKSIFNFVYAIALVGMVLSCVSILSEFFNISQLYGVNIDGNYILSPEEKYYAVSYFFYLFAFIISSSVAVFIFFDIFNLIKKIKMSNKVFTIIICAACGTLFLMSFIIMMCLRYKIDSAYQSYGIIYSLDNFIYLIGYTFRTCIMSFIANAGIVVACNVLNEKCKKNDAESGEDA
jgi:hypothetical protein